MSERETVREIAQEYANMSRRPTFVYQIPTLHGGKRWVWDYSKPSVEHDVCTPQEIDA